MYKFDWPLLLRVDDKKSNLNPIGPPFWASKAVTNSKREFETEAV